MVKSCIFIYTIMCISYNAKNFLQLNFPHPCWFLGSPISSQLSRSIILISTLESRESFSSASAIAPDTSGVDMDVPLFMLYRFPAPGVHAMICRPGATRSGLHRKIKKQNIICFCVSFLFYLCNSSFCIFIPF